MPEVTLECKSREKGKKSIITKLRQEGFVPGVFYKHGEENILFSAKEIKLKPLIFSDETFLVNLVIDNKPPEKCIIKEFQLDPVTDRILHVDMLGLKEGEKITVDVPVHLVGNAIGSKEGGIVQHSLHKVQVEVLPTQIPDRINIDISNLKIGDSIHVKDLKLENVRFLSNPEATIVAVVTPTVMKEKTPEEAAQEAAEEAKEPEVISKGKKTEEE